MIPKQVFFFWGNKTMSWMRYMTLYSFRKFNPDWKMILYTSENNVTVKTWDDAPVQDSHLYKGKDYTDKIKDLDIEVRQWNISENSIIPCDIEAPPNYLSDLFKWSIMYEEGGIFSDMDILWFRPIDGLYNAMNELNTNTGLTESEYLSVGLLASTKGNEFFKDVFVNSIKSYTNKEYQSAGVTAIYSMFVNNRCILNSAREKYPGNVFYNIYMKVVYFLDSDNVKKAVNNRYGIADFPPEAIGYHWYAGHPAIQAYNCIIDDENKHQYPMTFTQIAKEIG